MKYKSNPALYQQMQRFADLTITLILQGRIERANRCLKKAEEILIKGTAEIKNAVANVYVFSVTSFMEIHHCNIRNLFPELLQAEYKKQVNSCYP